MPTPVYLSIVVVVYISSMCLARDALKDQQRLLHRMTENISGGSGSTRNGIDIGIGIGVDVDVGNSRSNTMSSSNWLNLLKNAEKKDIKTEVGGGSGGATVMISSNNHHHNLLRSHSTPYGLLRTSSLPSSSSSPSQPKSFEQPGLKIPQQEWYSEKNFPINYYTYNDTTDDGNYIPSTSTGAEFQLIEPYILTISKMHTHSGTGSGSQTGLNSDAILKRRVAYDTASKATDAISSSPISFRNERVPTLPKDVVVGHNIVKPQTIWSQDMRSNEKARDVATVISAQNEENNDGTGGFFDKTHNNVNDYDAHNGNDDDDADADDDNNKNDNGDDVGDGDGNPLHEIFSPLRNTLDKIIHFCDMAKYFISSDDDDDDYDEKEIANEKSHTDELTHNDGEELKISTAADDDDNGQGQMNESSKSALLSSPRNMPSASRRQMTTASSSSSSSSLPSSIGTGRKIKKFKKKLSKLILPLLLAYKLKFLTLIPVLIGGLILLVGTTGLAGFFFALFTAVMSLKSAGGSSKSIIVKKDISYL